MQAAGAALAPLVALVLARAVPLHMAVALFDSKVDGLLEANRWILALAPGGLSRLSDALASWARDLLGAPFWRNEAVCRSELGWSISGAARGVRSVAMRRARMLHLPNDDLYRSACATAEHLGVGWGHASKLLLIEWGIPDFDGSNGVSTLESYKSIVLGRIRAAELPKWQAKVSKHTAQVPYSLLHEAPSDILRHVKSLANEESPLPWDAQISMRGWCRMRAGITCLRAKHGRRSEARHQQCVLCNCGLRNATVHAIACCAFFQDQRNRFLDAVPALRGAPNGTVTLGVLGASPSKPGFVEAVRLADAIDRAATLRWQGSVLL